jgi:hypothetical protein
LHFSLLTNPEVLRQLQTIQQTMTAGQTGELDIDKLRKLQEMKQQEEEFDKHLAQTVPVRKCGFVVDSFVDSVRFRIFRSPPNANSNRGTTRRCWAARIICPRRPTSRSRHRDISRNSRTKLASRQIWTTMCSLSVAKLTTAPT